MIQKLIEKLNKKRLKERISSAIGDRFKFCVNAKN